MLHQNRLPSKMLVQKNKAMPLLAILFCSIVTLVVNDKQSVTDAKEVLPFPDVRIVMAKQFAIQTTYKINYMRFESESYLPITPDSIRREPQIVSDDSELRVMLLYHLAEGGPPAKLDLNSIRFRMEITKTKQVILVDQDGVVRKNGKDYYMIPIEFLRLNRRLEKLFRLKQAK